MKRIMKAAYVSDEGKELLTVRNGKVSIECAYATFDPKMLRELSTACAAAAEELESLKESDIVAMQDAALKA